MSAEQQNAAHAINPLRYPGLVVFVSNTCLMVVQLVASRLVAPIVGVSIYTWTSIIGVMLAGISLGNYLSGVRADRGVSRNWLAGALIVTALTVGLVLVLFTAFGDSMGIAPLFGAPLIVRLMFFFFSMFFLPSVMLGTISPIVIKLAMRDLSRTGATMGRISAASTLGNILGTFATGYALISWFGTRTVLLGVVVALAALGLWLGRWGASRVWSRGLAGALVAGLIATPFTPLAAVLRGPCLRETDYFCIKVREDEKDGKTFRVLTLDRLVHSYTVIGDPREMRYQYEKVAAEVSDFLAERDGKITSFFIGGGGYSLPKYMEAEHPESLVTVAEIDPGVTEVAHEKLDLARDTKIRSFNQDARLYLSTAPPTVKYNYVLGDAFNDFSVPYHLTTHEFNQLVRSHMTDDGIYVLNLIDGNSLPFVSAFLRTLKLTFDNVYLVTSGSKLLGSARNTYVVLASPKPLDMAKLRQYASSDNARNLDAWLVADDEVTALMATDTLVLTDDFVPTDRLLAPMFEASEEAR